MMFSTNPFPHPTSTIQVFPPSNPFQDPQTHDHYINHHRSNNSGDCFPAKENLTTTRKQHLIEELGLELQCDDQEYDQLFWSEVKNKKDHHSKIHTPQGPRDRRVRLSIEVAKKFFFLQDLLGVDKPSETLDWLFNKSKISIDELIKTKKQTSSSTVTDQSEVIFLETTSDEQTRKKKCGEEKRKNISTRNYKPAGLNQSRADARARARERTKEKLSVKKLGNNKSKSVHVDCFSSNPTLQYSSFWNSVESPNGYDDDKISNLYSYKYNLAASSKLTGLPKFTDLHDHLQADSSMI